MPGKYTRDEMLRWLKKHFYENGYEVILYSKEFLPARVPLSCVKKEDDRILEQLVVEITTDENLSIEDFFPKISIKNVVTPEVRPVTIPGACPMRFYQYYFPNAKIFFAYPDFAKEESKFTQFKELCVKKGIGLLKTSEAEIEEVVPPRSLFNEVCNQLLNAGGNRTKIEKIMGDHLEGYLHFLVYYPKPVYARRAIIGRDDDAKEMISFVLIDKQRELRNIVYRKELKKLASKYRQQDQSDYDIAEEYIALLWRKYLGMKYPNIQRRVESILQRDEIYREHFVHQFQVFLIGAYILDKMRPQIARRFAQKHKCKIELAWLAASTFHDFNYGLQNFEVWLLQFFQDTLRVKNKQTKESLTLLNLDAAMIREALFDKITLIIRQMFGHLEDSKGGVVARFFYEKAVTDRNHGVLSAISLLKLFDETSKTDRKIRGKGVLEAAASIACHDEDIWEPLCACQGYRRSSIRLPATESECVRVCDRKSSLWPSKNSRIFKERDGPDHNCESWEREFMKEQMIDKITFDANPILFLLILCDSVQDEGRTTSSCDSDRADRSSLVDLLAEGSSDEVLVDIRLESQEALKKEKEIERLAWCLNDRRFQVSVNGNMKKMNGSGG